MANLSIGKPESESTKAQMEFAEDIEASRTSSKEHHNMDRVVLTEEDVSTTLILIAIGIFDHRADVCFNAEQENLSQDR